MNHLHIYAPPYKCLTVDGYPIYYVLTVLHLLSRWGGHIQLYQYTSRWSVYTGSKLCQYTLEHIVADAHQTYCTPDIHYSHQCTPGNVVY
jgi:hypothetical protein